MGKRVRHESDRCSLNGDDSLPTQRVASKTQKTGAGPPGALRVWWVRRTHSLPTTTLRLSCTIGTDTASTFRAINKMLLH